jgi:hypothetical protein
MTTAACTSPAYLTLDQLYLRGWTRPMIASLLPAPDMERERGLLLGRLRLTTSEKLYLLPRVEAVEGTDAYQLPAQAAYERHVKEGKVLVLGVALILLLVLLAACAGQFGTNVHLVAAALAPRAPLPG